MTSRGEERAGVFVLTALSTGLLTESLTRFISLMRVTPSVVLCGLLGVLALGFLFMHFALSTDF